MKKFMLGAVLATTFINANALEVITARVVFVEPTYMPSVVTFTLDSGSASCPAGKLLTWQKSDPDNNKAIFAVLLLSLSNGKRVRMHVNDGDITCQGQFLHLLND